jgi:hypothetical protein
MAIATMTAGTAALISAGVAAAGTAASVGMNLSAAAKQSKAQSAAEQAASEAAAKAEASYQQEFAGGVQLPMEAYQQAGREGTAQQMQALQALQEADTRSLAAGVGKVQAAATEAQAGITDQMRQDLFALESTQMKEKMANRDAIAKMNQERAMGAQAAAANAEVAKTRAYGNIGQSITSLGGMALQAAPLYGTGGATATSAFSNNPANTQLPSTLSGFTNTTPSAFNPPQVPGLTSPSVLSSGFDLNKFNQQNLDQFKQNNYMDNWLQQQQNKGL